MDADEDGAVSADGEVPTSLGPAGAVDFAMPNVTAYPAATVAGVSAEGVPVLAYLSGS